MTEKKISAALYMRVSTEYQVERDSLPAQKSMLISYATDILKADRYELFVDPGYTGTNMSRPAFQDMMRRCQAGEFTHVVAIKIDRISRSIVDFSNMSKIFQDHGIIFISIQENISTGSVFGQMMSKLSLIFAEMEIVRLRERVQMVMKDRAVKGKWNGGRVPLGYNITKNMPKAVIIEHEAEIVRLIFRLFTEEHMSTQKIAVYLNDRRLYTRSGNTWIAATVAQIIKQPVYMGIYRWNRATGKKRKEKQPGEWIENDSVFPPLITKKVWDLAQSLFTKKICYPAKEQAEKHLFYRLLSCEHCGHFMVAYKYRLKGSTLHWSRYRCRKTEKDNEHTGCVTDLEIGPFVFQYIRNILAIQEHPEKYRDPVHLQEVLLEGTMFADVEGIRNIRDIFSVMLETGHVDYYPEQKKTCVSSEAVKMNENRIKKIRRALKRLKDLYLYADDAMTEEEYIQEKNSLEEQLARYDRRTGTGAVSVPAMEIPENTLLNRFLMLRLLVDGKQKNHDIDLAALVSEVDRSELHYFLRSIIETIIIDSSRRIRAIRFKNGLTHTFIYKGGKS